MSVCKLLSEQGQSGSVLYIITRLDAGAGLAVRMPVTFLVMMGSKFNFLEKLFFAIAWSPKVSMHPASQCR